MPAMTLWEGGSGGNSIITFALAGGSGMGSIKMQT